MSSRFKGNAALLMAAILWGTGFVAQKLGMETLPPIAFNSIRQIMAVVVLLPLMFYDFHKSGYISKELNSPAQIARKRNKLLAGGAVCGIFLCAGTILQQMGLMTVSIGKSGFISSMYLVFAPLFSAVLGARVSRKSVFCIFLALTGFGVMSLSGGLGNATSGDWLTLLSTVSLAAQIVAIDRFVDYGNAISLSVIEMLFSGVAGMILSVIIEHPAFDAFIACMPVLIYSILFPTAMGYTFQIVGQKYTDSTAAALIMSTESIFSAIFGTLLLNETMSAREIIGSIIIFTAIIIGQTGKTQDKPKTR